MWQLEAWYTNSCKVESLSLASPAGLGGAGGGDELQEVGWPALPLIGAHQGWGGRQEDVTIRIILLLR